MTVCHSSTFLKSSDFYDLEHGSKDCSEERSFRIKKINYRPATFINAELSTLHLTENELYSR